MRVRDNEVGGRPRARHSGPAYIHNDRIPAIIREIAQSSPHGEALAARLEDLVAAIQEEGARGSEATEVSAPSLRDFAGFMSHERRLVRPRLTITLEGHVRAEWRQDADHRVAVEFVGYGDAKIVVFAPLRESERVLRFSRRIPVVSVVEAAAPYDVPLLVEGTPDSGRPSPDGR